MLRLYLVIIYLIQHLKRQEIHYYQILLRAAISLPNEEVVANLSNGDFAIIEGLNEIPKRWNDEALIFVTVYLDPEVTWERIP